MIKRFPRLPAPRQRWARLLARGLPLLLLALLLVVFGYGLRLDPSRVPSALIGLPMPAFVLPRLQAAEQFDSATLHGQPLLLNVWASWCLACRQEHALLLELAGSETVALYGLNYKDERGEARQWLRTMGGNPYREVAFDRDGAVGLLLGVYGVPETFLVDAQGVIRYRHVGPLTRQALEQEILPRLGRLRVQPSS